jgi:hypothetical protein
MILNSKINHILKGSILPDLLRKVHQSLGNTKFLTAAQRVLVGEAFADAFGAQMRLCCYVSVGAVVVSVAAWRKERTALSKPE